MNFEIIVYYIYGILIVFSILIAVIAQLKVQSAYSKFSQEKSSLNLTGGELAKKLAQDSGLFLNINTCNGTLSDHYNSKDKSLNISQGNYNSDSIAAISVVAHEFGHALQDSEDYFPLKLRQFAIKVSNFASRFLILFIIVSIILSLFIGMAGSILTLALVIIYGLSLIANFVTLPVELNASKRAKQILSSMVVTREENDKVKKMLSAAAMTYTASLLVSLAYFLRFLSIFMLTRRD